MSAMEIVNEVRSLGAHIESRGDRLHIDAPAGKITPELKTRLIENKAEILKRLQLEASLRRLEAAGINIAVFDDGSMLVLTEEADNVSAIDHKGTIYSPRDMLMYVTLSENDRRMMHAFKKLLPDASWEWREP
jgi:hypothetical protein